LDEMRLLDSSIRTWWTRCKQ